MQNTKSCGMIASVKVVFPLSNRQMLKHYRQADDFCDDTSQKGQPFLFALLCENQKQRRYVYVVQSCPYLSVCHAAGIYLPAAASAAAIGNAHYRYSAGSFGAQSAGPFHPVHLCGSAQNRTHHYLDPRRPQPQSGGPEKGRTSCLFDVLSSCVHGNYRNVAAGAAAVRTEFTGSRHPWNRSCCGIAGGRCS